MNNRLRTLLHRKIQWTRLDGSDNYPIIPKQLILVDGKLKPACGDNCIPREKTAAERADETDGTAEQLNIYKQNRKKLKSLFLMLTKDKCGSVHLHDLEDTLVHYCTKSFCKTLFTLLGEIVDDDGFTHYTIGELMRVVDLMRPGFPRSDVPPWIAMSTHKAVHADWSSLGDTAIEALKLNTLGNEAMSEGQYQDAYKYFQAACLKYPHNQNLTSNRANAMHMWEESSRIPLMPFLKSVDVAKVRRLLSSQLKYKLDDENVDPFTAAVMHDSTGTMALHMLKAYEVDHEVLGLPVRKVSVKLLLIGLMLFSNSAKWEKIEMIMEYMAAQTPDRRLSRQEIHMFSMDIYRAAGRLVQAIMPTLCDASRVTNLCRTTCEVHWVLCVDNFFKTFAATNASEDTRIRPSDFSRFASRSLPVKGWLDKIEKICLKEIFNPKMRYKEEPSLSDLPLNTPRRSNQESFRTQGGGTGSGRVMMLGNLKQPVPPMGGRRPQPILDYGEAPSIRDDSDTGSGRRATRGRLRGIQTERHRRRAGELSLDMDSDGESIDTFQTTSPPPSRPTTQGSTTEVLPSLLAPLKQRRRTSRMSTTSDITKSAVSRQHSSNAEKEQLRRPSHQRLVSIRRQSSNENFGIVYRQSSAHSAIVPISRQNSHDKMSSVSRQSSLEKSGMAESSQGSAYFSRTVPNIKC